jgi:hypothetical protein
MFLVHTSQSESNVGGKTIPGQPTAGMIIIALTQRQAKSSIGKLEDDRSFKQ